MKQEIKFSKVHDPRTWNGASALFECKTHTDAMVAEHIFNSMIEQIERYRAALIKLRDRLEPDETNRELYFVAREAFEGDEL